MAGEGEIHVADVGTRLYVTVKESGVVVDLSGASEITLVIRRKDKSVITKTLSDDQVKLYTDGSDGKIYYDLIAGDITIKGDYSLQVNLEYPNGFWHSDTQTFAVAENLKD